MEDKEARISAEGYDSGAEWLFSGLEDEKETL